MIKFFRKVRQKLLSENKFSKYLIYSIGEIILVVIGILIALQINNWNENNKLEAKKQDYYQQLLADLKKDKEFSTKTIEQFNRLREEYNNYRNEFYSNNLTVKEVYEKLLNLNFESVSITFSSNTTETLQNSGEMVLIPSEIRNKLIDLKNFQNTIKANSLANNLQKNNITQKVFSLFGNIDLQERVASQKDLESLVVTDENRREIILGWENMQGWKNFSENNSRRQLQDMLEDIDDIEQKINTEIK